MRRLFSADGALFLKAAVLLALVRLALLVGSFRLLLRIANRASAASSGLGRTPGTSGIERVRWAVLRASRSVPGTRHCLTQALVAKILLGRQDEPVGLRIGVAKNSGHIVAHAWLESKGTPIFGATESELRDYSFLPQIE